MVFTGGTDGIGRCAVEMLCDMGADVVLLARSTVKGEAVVDVINAKGKGRATYKFATYRVWIA
ncbi:MAG: SDR family NAD(P)-dependent oxidoreductase [Rikenellaceae bacterium]